MSVMHNAPIHAPISTINLKKIVDVGCGVNADMTRYLAKRFPDAHVYGVDLAPVTILAGHTPPNVTFIQGNIMELLDEDPRLASGSVDLLFSRLLCAGMQNWKIYIQIVTSLLSPGGLTEMQDLGTMHFINKDGDPAFSDAKWFHHVNHQMTSKMGLDMPTFTKADAVMREVTGRTRRYRNEGDIFELGSGKGSV